MDECQTGFIILVMVAALISAAIQENNKKEKEKKRDQSLRLDALESAILTPPPEKSPTYRSCLNERCGAHNPRKARFCRNCGTPLD